MKIDEERDKNAKVKSNLREIQSIVTDFVESLFACEDLFPPSFLELLRNLHSVGSRRFEETGVALIGGVLFLRLIGPAFVSPAKFGLIEGSNTFQKLIKQKTLSLRKDPEL